MRLRDMQIIVAANINLINLKKTSAGGRAPDAVTVSGFDAFRRAVRELAAVPALGFLAAPILSHDFVTQWVHDSITAPTIEFNAIMQQAIELKAASRQLLTSLDAVLPPLDNRAIVIELPPPKILADVVKTCNVIDELVAAVSPDEALRATVVAFDSGSCIMEILVALPNVALALYAMSKASTLMTKWIYNQVKEIHHMHALGAATEDITNSIGHKEKLRQLQLHAFARDIASEYVNDVSAERIKRIADAISKEQEMIERGFRLFPADPGKQERNDLIGVYADASKDISATKELVAHLQNAKIHASLPPKSDGSGSETKLN